MLLKVAFIWAESVEKTNLKQLHRRFAAARRRARASKSLKHDTDKAGAGGLGFERGPPGAVQLKKSKAKAR